MKKYVLLLVGIIFIIGAYVFNSYNLLRLLVLAVGILCIVLSYACKENKNVLLLFVLPIILVLVSLGIDNLLLAKLNRIPIYIYEIKSNDIISTYNSFFYRIYNCNGNYILDNGYKKNYACNVDDLDTISINSFLSETSSSFKKYNDKFIKVNGKISKISGIDTIELSFYEMEDDILNGHVKFNNSLVLRIKTNADLSNYRIYDDITVIGLVDNLKTEGDTSVVNLIDAFILPNDLYKNYSFEIIANDSKEEKEYIKDKNYYLYGLDNIFVKYSNDAIYELSYVITDDRINLDMLIKDLKVEEIKNDEDELLVKKYEKDKFNIYVCSKDSKTFFVNKNLKFNNKLCS